MNTTNTTQTRPPLETLAWVNERCESYGQAGRDSLTIRKLYGKDQLRYLRCRCGGAEFSERKHTALWNTKVREAKAVAVAEHLAEGCSLKATARLVRVNSSVVRRLNRKVGIHAEAFRDKRVQGLEVVALEADERHGYAHDKSQPQWEAEVIDPVSKLVVSHVQGQRDEALIRRLLEDAAKRLAHQQQLVLFTDGQASYARLFLEIFGQAYCSNRQGDRGRFPDLRYRIPRTLAHVQIVTARRMNAHQVRRSLAFSRRDDTKVALGWWGLTVYDWSRPHRSLRLPLPQPHGKKSSSHALRRWRWVWLTTSGQSGLFCSLRCSRREVRDYLMSLSH
jgi:IS1 family transposase